MYSQLVMAWKHWINCKHFQSQILLFPIVMDELKAKVRTFLEAKEAQRESNINEFEKKISQIIRKRSGEKREKSQILQKY